MLRRRARAVAYRWVGRAAAGAARQARAVALLLVVVRGESPRVKLPRRRAFLGLRVHREAGRIVLALRARDSTQKVSSACGYVWYPTLTRRSHSCTSTGRRGTCSNSIPSTGMRGLGLGSGLGSGFGVGVGVGLGIVLCPPHLHPRPHLHPHPSPAPSPLTCPVTVTPHPSPLTPHPTNVQRRSQSARRSQRLGEQQGQVRAQCCQQLRGAAAAKGPLSYAVTSSAPPWVHVSCHHGCMCPALPWVHMPCSHGCMCPAPMGAYALPPWVHMPPK